MDHCTYICINTAEPALESFKISEHVIPDPVTKPVNSYRNLRKRYRKLKQKHHEIQRSLSLYTRWISTNSADKVSRPSSCPPNMDLLPPLPVFSDPTVTSLPPGLLT